MGKLNKSLEVLKKLNYVVKMEQVGDLRYTVTYPPCSIYKKKYEGFVKEYSIEDGGVSLDGDFIELPPHLRRLAIFSDIASQLHYLNIDVGVLLFFKDGQEVANIFELIDVQLDEEGKTKEQLVYKLLVGEDVSAEDTKKVFRNFKLMKGLSL